MFHSIKHYNQQMPIKLYIDYISQPSRAVLAFCLLNKIQVELVEIRIAKLQHLTEDFQKINPMKKVPAIYDPENGLLLGQSYAIIGYLMRKHKLQQKWYKSQKGSDSLCLWAKEQEYLHYHHSNTRKCAMLLYTLVFARLYPVDHANLINGATIQKQVESILTFIEENYFKNSLFMLGEALTVADLAAYFEIQSLVLLDFPFHKWPKINQWLRQIQKIREVVVSNSNFLKMVPKMKRSLSAL